MMSGKHQHIAVAALTLLLCSLVQAAEPSQTATFKARPNIADYQDQKQFVIDVLEWERNQRSAATSSNSAVEINGSAPHDWHHITGPEDLSTAIKNADGYVQPNYKETYRFNRTTHISFPLPKLMSTEMAKEAATGSAEHLNNELLTQMEKLPEHVVDQINQLQAFSAQETTLKTLSSIPATN